MKKILLLIFKIVIILFLGMVWFFLLQGEYEIITKPYLRNEFPVIHGAGAVVVLAIVLIIIAIAIVTTILSIFREKNYGKHY